MRWQVERYQIQGPFARESLLIHLEEEGRTAIGEIAPLPGYSREDLASAEKQLHAYLNYFQKLYSGMQAPAPPPMYPSVEFGLLSAVEDLQAPPLTEPCPSHAYLFGTEEQILSKAESATCDTVKVKLTGKPLEESHRILSALMGRFKLRLDFNRQFSLDEALSFLSRFDPNAFDYIEEPLRNPRELGKLPYPVALDESLREPANWDLAKLPNCKALVLKPTLLGNIEPYLKMHPRCILGHTFEGPVGIAQIAKQAVRHQLQGELHGLDAIQL